jgi:predicted MFS family arabinose efflux permease
MRWRILALLFLARVGLGFQFQTLTSVGDELVAAYGLTHAQVGTLIGLFMASGLLLAFPAGLATRIASDRALAAFGLAILAAGGMISGLAPDPWTIGVGRLVAGVGFLVSTLYFTKMIADWFAGREIATAMSILVMSWPFGIAMGQIGHAWFAANADWRAPFVAASVYCAVAAFAILVLYRPATVQHSPHPSADKATPQFGLSSQEWALVIAAGIAWGVLNAGYVGYLTYGPKSLEGHGATPVDAAGIISIASWLMILSGAACGQLVDRMGRRNLILTMCMAAAVASLALLQIDGAGPFASVLFGLIGMAPAGVIMALAGEAVPPERRAFGMGVFFTIYYAIMTGGPPIAGWLYDSLGSTTPPLLFAALLFLAVLPAVLAFDAVQAQGAARAFR